jgi:hypothetical protein
MINAPQLLADLKRRLTLLEADLRDRINALPELKASLNDEWQAACEVKRTAETFESWSDQVITQAGVHWLLSCVFLRFIEDNTLVDRPWISGTPLSGRLSLARDRHEAYFRAQPLECDRDYLLACFTEAGTLHGLHTFFDSAHNPVFRLGISGDAAIGLRQFWQQQDPNTGALRHDFFDPTWNTRFLGDLYQDLSEATRKRYALLQTPEFVEEFILDRTLTPAIREFGYREVRLIDPTCGSGHFLLGGFDRMVGEWSRSEPARHRRDVAQKALDAVSGIDLNPFAVAIARFRLLVAALKVCDVHRLSEAPDFKINVAIGDSLLHGKRFGLRANEDMFQSAEHFRGTGLEHVYAGEDLAEVQRILGRQYHAVVGNPPYIVVKDAALSAAYRSRYASCHKKYSLGAPFTERFFELALTPTASHNAGFVGLITTNSFMKREFGSKLIEQVLPRLDLTHVIDTSGAYIPGHGTPTVILLGRHRPPVSQTVRTVMGIKGEPGTPDDPALGLVWSAILNQMDIVGSRSEFVSVGDTQRAVFGKHPWSMGGGGEGDLKEKIESNSVHLSSITTDLGFVCITKADDVFVLPRKAAVRKGCEISVLRPFATGEEIRDWVASNENNCLFPYNDHVELNSESAMTGALRFMWRCRVSLLDRKVFGGATYLEVGKPWYSYGQIPVERFKIQLAITFAEITTHNHFVLDRGGKVFKQTAPVIKLPAGTSEDEHLGLLGLLNSSVACFWLKQVCFNKGGGGSGTKLASETWENFYGFNSTNIAEFPVVADKPLAIARQIDALAQALVAVQPAALLATVSIVNYASAARATGQKGTESAHDSVTPMHADVPVIPAKAGIHAGLRGNDEVMLPTRASLNAARAKATQLRQQMIAWQEELDWRCYQLYGLTPTELTHPSPPKIALGERAFEIVLARRVAAGQTQTNWFERHGSTPITNIPSHWPTDYQHIVQRRIDQIETDSNIKLIERPEYKRRWNTPQWNDLEHAALRDWLLARLESPRYWASDAQQPPTLTSTSRLADQAKEDADFMQVAALYAGHADFNFKPLVAELIASEAVPFLPVLRYTESGLRKRAQWEATWALQRREDAGEEVGTIPVPPKYKNTDFSKTDYWRLRGGLDVPKERWVSYPGCERGVDGSGVIAWAGWNHLQQATALAGFYLDMKDNEGWPPERLQPLLSGLLELIPWLLQWHNEVDPVYGERMGAYYQGFVAEEARALGFTLDDLQTWKPVVMAATRGRRKAAA